MSDCVAPAQAKEGDLVQVGAVQVTRLSDDQYLVHEVAVGVQGVSLRDLRRIIAETRSGLAQQERLLAQQERLLALLEEQA